MGQYVTVEKNVKVFVEDIGQGRPILFIHGWPLSHETFEYQMNEIPQKGYRFIGMDLRGHGKSDRPLNGYTYDRMADDIKAVIDELQLENVILAGFSMGGPIAIRYMTRHHQYKVSKLALLSAALPIFTQREDYPLGMKQEEVDELIQQIKNDRPAALADFGGKFFSSNVSKPFSEWFLRIALQASSHATIQSALSLRNEDLRLELSEITVPTLIMHGMKDEICPYDFAVEQAKLLSNNLLVSFENAGHGIFYDEKEKFNSELLDFIKI